MEPDQAVGIIDAMEERVRARWYAVAREAGVTACDCDKIASAFAYPGFRQRTAR